MGKDFTLRCVVSLNEIHIAHMEATGQAAAISTTNRLLRRHGRRKVKPDTKHPERDPSIQEEFKKNSKAWRIPPLRKT
jgi:hypothetical protein